MKIQVAISTTVANLDKELNRVKHQRVSSQIFALQHSVEKLKDCLEELKEENKNTHSPAENKLLKHFIDYTRRDIEVLEDLLIEKLAEEQELAKTIN